MAVSSRASYFVLFRIAGTLLYKGEIEELDDLR
jgi:hypothetical protein